MRLFILLAFIAFVLHCSYAPPVTPGNKIEQEQEETDLAQYTKYHRYLKEVVQALESDPQFRDRLERANEDDVRSGRIAEDLDFVHHNVRTQLDEIKRREIDRLRHLASKGNQLANEVDAPQKLLIKHKQSENEHLDHKNPHTFEVEDLKRLIKKTTEDLEAVDKKRREQFKEYEMQKEFEKQQKIEHMDEAQKKEYMENFKKEEEAKKHHKPLHHPGSKQQLEEVWEKQDHIDQQFDPKAFFMMHDVDGNGSWDPDEVKALFIKELDKMYGPEGPNKDLHERAEEMERMREHFFQENDRNRDGLIDFSEFIAETRKEEFNQDQGWKPLDENQIYSQAEYEEYEKRKLETMHYLQQRGLIDAQGRPVPGSEHQIHQAIQEFHHMQQAQAQYQQYQGQYPQGQVQHPGQVNQNQYQHPGQIPQGQYRVPSGQVPPDQYQIPQGQALPEQYQGQAPSGQYQVPQGQPPVPQAQAPQGQYQAPPVQAAQGQYQAPPVQAAQGQYQAPPVQAAQDQYQAPPAHVQGQHRGPSVPAQQGDHAPPAQTQQAPQVEPGQGSQGQPPVPTGQNQTSINH